MLFGLQLDALLLVSCAALLVGISKAGFGGGVGVVATPLVALAMPVAEAAALMLPILIGTDLFTVWHYRRTASAKDLRLLLPASLLGIAAGALTFEALADSDRLLRAGIGILALAFVAWRLASPLLAGRLRQASPPSRLLGGLMGVLAGFGSTLAHAGGPPITIYLLPRRLARQVFVGTTAWFFFVINLVKLIPYHWLGLISLERVALAAALLPVAALGTWLGIRTLRSFEERIFFRLVTLILALTGLQLLLGRDLSSFFG